jgi:hypothetical protein
LKEIYYKEWEDEEEDVSRNWTTLWKREDTEVERGRTRTHPAKNSLWKGLSNSRQKNYVMMVPKANHIAI